MYLKNIYEIDVNKKELLNMDVIQKSCKCNKEFVDFFTYKNDNMNKYIHIILNIKNVICIIKRW